MAYSSVRTVVVPTATIRRCCSSARLMLRGGFRGDRVRLLMQPVILDALDAHGLKRAQADVQGEFGDLDATLLKAGEDFRGEVQSGRGGGDRAAFARIDGLVALVVGGAVGAVDVGRQGDVADLVDDLKEVFYRRESNAPLAKGAATQNFRVQLVTFAKIQTFTDADFPPGTNRHSHHWEFR